MWTGIRGDVRNPLSDVTPNSGSHPTTAPPSASQDVNVDYITNIEVLLLMLILIHIDLELVVLQFTYLQVFFLLFLLVNPEEDSGVTGEKQIGDLLIQMENTNRWFAFLLCLLSPLQEAHRPSINILFIRSSRCTWSYGQSCCKPNCRIKSGMNRLYPQHSQYIWRFSNLFLIHIKIYYFLIQIFWRKI